MSRAESRRAASSGLCFSSLSTTCHPQFSHPSTYLSMMPSSIETSHQTTTPLHSSTTFSNWRNGQRNGRALHFNSSKCKLMHLGRQNPNRDYTMGATTLATTTSEKDLGVYVDTELTFEKHIETVVNQANRMLGLIRRSYTYLDSQSLLKLYTSLVRPMLEYANAAWTPILRRDQILLENVQRRATKVIPELRDRDYEDRLRALKLPSLYYRRARGDMIEAYKFTHSIYKTEQEPLQRESNTTTRGHSHKLKKECCKTRTRANFFRHRITNRWNNLWEDVVTAPSLNSFKSRLDHQWCTYKYSNNNDFPPMCTNIKPVQNG